MKALGIIRKVDDLGRIVIPIELRKTMLMDVGTPMEFFTDDKGGIVLKKYSMGCNECGDSEAPLVGKIKICIECASKLANY